MASQSFLYYTRVPAVFGTLGLFSTESGICRVSLQETAFQDFFEKAVRASRVKPVRDDARLQDTAKELENYFKGRIHKFRSKIDLGGMTPFQQRVLRALLEIPYGTVRSYQWVAERIGNPLACRAVGAACAANPVPILVPCHRVIAKAGTLGGFSAGLQIKQRLLDLERGDT